jgi:hypothetical protein
MVVVDPAAEAIMPPLPLIPRLSFYADITCYMNVALRHKRQ